MLSMAAALLPVALIACSCWSAESTATEALRICPDSEEECQEIASMMQVSVQLDTRTRVVPTSLTPTTLEHPASETSGTLAQTPHLTPTILAHPTSETNRALPQSPSLAHTTHSAPETNRTRAQLDSTNRTLVHGTLETSLDTDASESESGRFGFRVIPKWERDLATRHSHCLPFETRTGKSGLPVYMEALIFGLLSAISLPIGAGLGAYFHPVSVGVTSRWMAVGAGALVFSVATQIYGNSLFELLTVPRYGPLDKGCKKINGVDICDEKLSTMLTLIAAGIVGAYIYVTLDKSLHQWSQNEKGKSDAASTILSSTPFSSPAHSDVDPDDAEPQTLMSPRTGHAVVNSNVALSIFLGCLLDSVPSAIMLGLLTNRHQVSFGFLFALAMADFPQAFSGSSILLSNGMTGIIVFVLWTSIFFLTGVVALLASFFFPETCTGETFSVSALYGTAIAEGLTGGLMLAMLATAMLPASYKGAKHAAGMYFVLGFCLSILFETLNSYFAGPQQLLHRHPSFAR